MKLENQQHTRGASFELAMPFDSVEYEALLDKLCFYFSMLKSIIYLIDDQPRGWLNTFIAGLG